jgi:ParB family chromosome partitioning protein
MEDKNFKKPVRSALGRGLSSLISGTPVPVAPHRMNISIPQAEAQTFQSGNLAADLSPRQSSSENSVSYLLINQVVNNPKQPRQEFEQLELNELAESIKSLGVLQPILVRPSSEKPGFYEIVAGERRWRAAKIANLNQVPAIIQNLSDKQTLEISIVENVQRAGLNPIEEATAYDRLMLEFNLGQKEVAERVGKDRTSIANITRLLKLPLEVQQFIKENKLSVGHAKAILTIKEPHAQVSLAKKVINDGLSVRELEAIVSRVVVLDGARSKLKAGNKGALNKEIAFPEILDRMRNSLGTKVNINHKNTGLKAGSGKIEIEYYSEQELERIVDSICKI